MPFVIGLVLSGVVAGFARLIGFDRDRAFYPAVLMVVASQYVLFAVMSGSTPALAFESGVMTLFLLSAVAGFRTHAWIITAALAAHGFFDVVHGYVMENSGVPAWWPAFCLAYDAGAAASMVLANAAVPQGMSLGRSVLRDGTTIGRAWLAKLQRMPAVDG